MRVKTALALLLVVNVLWAAAVMGYLRRPQVVPARGGVPSSIVFVPPATNKAAPAPPPAPQIVYVTNLVTVPAVTSGPALEPRSVASAGRKFGWQDVTNEAYADYVLRLRAAGCPDAQVRQIVLSDVNALIDQRRLEHAIKHDSQWWVAETYMGVLPAQSVPAANLDAARRELLVRILGESVVDSMKLPTLKEGAIPLTGPVLGALPEAVWNVVQEVGNRSMERHQAAQLNRINEGAAVDNAELARLRHQTRMELARLLSPEQLEEFLLRYSHNASRLRSDLRGVDPTPDEFRRFFRVIDALEHQLQVEYGGEEALSAGQRAQVAAQRDRAAREIFPPDKLQRYLATKDPLYKQAQIMAMQYGLNGQAVQALHQMQKSLDARRAAVAQDSKLTAEQKNQALQSISIEHQQALQRILANTGFRR